MKKLRDRLFVSYLRATEHPGKLRLVRWLARWFIPERGVVTEVGSGVKLLLHPRDWIEYLLLRTSTYEPLTLSFIDQNLASGDIALLAGVNFGLHVIRAARAVGSSGMVFGVEPQPASLLRAWENATLNGLTSSIRLANIALGDDTELHLMASRPVDNSGAASLNDAPSDGGIVAAVLPARRVLGLLGVRHLRLFLLDVQGFETRVLKGLEGGVMPQLLVLEVDPLLLGRAGSDAAQLAAVAEYLGYSLFDLHGRPFSPGTAVDESNVVGVASGCSVRWV